MGVVELLECLSIACIAGHITDKQDHGGRILKGRMYADRGIGRPRAPGHKADPGSARQSPLCIGHEGRSTLLATGDKTDLVTVTMKTVQYCQIALAWNPKCMGHALGQKAFNKQVAGNG